MSGESSWNQKQVALLPPCNISPALLNWKSRPVSLLPYPVPRNEFNMIPNVNAHPQNHQVLKYEYSKIQIRDLPGRESRMIQWPHPLVNQPLVNGPNTTPDSNLLHQLSSNKNNVFKAFHPPTDRMFVNKSNGTAYLQPHQLSSEGVYPPTDQMLVKKLNGTNYLHQHQLSSERTHDIQNFHPITYQLSANESNLSQQSYSQSHQLLSNGISTSQNSNMFNQQLSQMNYLPTHGLNQCEFRRNQVKYSSDIQEPGRESFKSHSYPLSNLQEIGFSKNYELPILDPSLYKNMYPKYFEKVHICVIGPPGCGKADLIRTFARNDNIQISTDRPLSWVDQQRMFDFGTTLEIGIWYGEDLISAIEDIKSLCQSTKSVIALVYNVAQESTLSTVLEWINLLKKDKDFKVPIFLIGNTADVDCLSISRDITPNLVQWRDRVGAKDGYDLAAFYECSTKCVDDVMAIFYFATLKAFRRTIKKSVLVL